MDNKALQEKMWKLIRILKNFTALELTVIAMTSNEHITEDLVESYCETLFNNSYLVKGGERYQLVKNTGYSAPFITPLGALVDPNLINLGPRYAYKTLQQRIWEVMQELKQFTLITLYKSVTSEGGKPLNKGSIKAYFYKLLEHEYIAFIGEDETLSLIKNTGYHAPQVLKDKSLQDINIGELFKPREKLRRPKVKQGILQLIKSGKKFTPRDLYDQMGGDIDVIRKALRRLKVEKILVVVGKRDLGKGHIEKVYTLSKPSNQSK